MMKIKILRELVQRPDPLAAPQQAAPQQAAPQQAAPQQAEAAQSPEQIAQSAYSILEKMVNEKIVPTITKTIQDAMKGQQAPKEQPAQAVPAPPAQKSAQPAPAAPAKGTPPQA